MTPTPRLFSFLGGHEGPWIVSATRRIVGEPLPHVAHLSLVDGTATARAPAATWILRGVTSNERYVTRPEKEQLLARQQGLGRPAADRAALIPLRKSATWWAMTQDERRRIFEEQSHHTEIGLEYLPAVARRLHHCRDLADPEPFDFLTWFEFARQDEAAFDELLARLRATREWDHVEREVELRLTRAGTEEPG